MEASYPRQCPRLDNSGRLCRYMFPSLVSFRRHLCIHHGEQLMVSHSGGGISETFSRLPPDELRRRRAMLACRQGGRRATRRYWEQWFAEERRQSYRPTADRRPRKYRTHPNNRRGIIEVLIIFWQGTSQTHQLWCRLSLMVRTTLNIPTTMTIWRPAMCGTFTAGTTCRSWRASRWRSMWKPLELLPPDSQIVVKSGCAAAGTTMGRQLRNHIFRHHPLRRRRLYWRKCGGGHSICFFSS